MINRLLWHLLQQVSHALTHIYCLSQQDCAQTHSALTRPPARADKQTPADFTQTQRNSNLTRQNKRYVLMCGRVIIEVYFQNSPLLFHLPVYQEPHLFFFWKIYRDFKFIVKVKECLLTKTQCCRRQGGLVVKGSHSWRIAGSLFASTLL